jgi:hypothetical protein
MYVSTLVVAQTPLSTVASQTVSSANTQQTIQQTKHNKYAQCASSDIQIN